MSMSTSGVPRPSPLGKISAKKAVPAAGDKPDDTETSVEESPTDKAPVRAPGRSDSPARKSPAAKTRTPARAAARPGTKGTAGKGPVKAGGKGRRLSQPIKVYHGRNWGSIMLFASVGVVALAIIGFAIYAIASRPDPTKWKERADAIPGIVDYR